MEVAGYDWTALYEGRRWGKRLDPDEVVEAETLTLSPIPCWQSLSEDELRERLVALVETLERENAERRGPHPDRIASSSSSTTAWNSGTL